MAIGLKTTDDGDRRAPWCDGHWWSNDGLRLHYRDYPCQGRTMAGDGPDGARPALICLPGLTRNSRDFEDLALKLAVRRRVVAIDWRGRGQSAYARDPLTYTPLTYVQDLARLRTDLGLERVILLGTSLGGIVTMLAAGAGARGLEGVVLNDVGPVIDAAGLARIRAGTSRGGSWPTWIHAARALSEAEAAIYPDYELGDWLHTAKQRFRLTTAGRIVPDYDLNIAEVFRLPGGEAGVDLWPALSALRDLPVLIVRGARSDILSAATVRAMRARLPLAEAVEVPRIGHAPTLTEPAAFAALSAFLDTVDRRIDGRKDAARPEFPHDLQEIP